MNKIRELRASKGISMKELGKIIGLAESTISLYENGKRQPEQGTLILIADYFNVSLDYLLGRDVPPSFPLLSNNEQRLLQMYNLLTDIEKGEIIGELKSMTKDRRI